MWFKEYVFNLLIQPFHLLIYTILVGSAMELASTSLIYAIVAIYFVIPAEKLLRKFFGFDNAGTLSAAGSFAGGALFSAMISRINKPKPQDQDNEEKPKNMRKSSGGAGIRNDEAIFGTQLPDASGGGAGGRTADLEAGGGAGGLGGRTADLEAGGGVGGRTEVRFSEMNLDQ